MLTWKHTWKFVGACMLTLGWSAEMAYGQASSYPAYTYTSGNPPFFPTKSNNYLYSVDTRAANGYMRGSDGGWLAPMTPQTSVWMLGDVYVGISNSTNRGPPLVHNALTTATNSNGYFIPTYYYRGTVQAPAAFFDLAHSSTPNSTLYGGPPTGSTNNTAEVFWPHKTFVYNTGGANNQAFLFVFLYNVVSGYDGMTLARINITNTQNPMNWTYDLLPVGSGRLINSVYVGWESYLTGDGNVYVFGVSGQNSVSLYSFPLSRLTTVPAGTDISQYASTLTGAAGAFTPGLTPNTAIKTTIPNAYDGFSCRYNPSTGKWQALYVAYNYSSVGPSPTVGGPNNDAFAWLTIGNNPFTFSPTNPSTTQAIWRFKETWSGNPNNGDTNTNNGTTPADTTTSGNAPYHRDAYVYNAIEHYEFEPNPSNQILFTYNNNQLPGNISWVLSDSNYQNVTTVGVGYPNFPSGGTSTMALPPATNSRTNRLTVKPK